MKKEKRYYDVGRLKIVRRNFTLKDSEQVVEQAYGHGLGIPTGRMSKDLGGFREVIMPGAITLEVMERSDPLILFNHDPNLILGRVKTGSARYWQEADGWHYEFALPDTSAGRDVKYLLERGDLNGSSFAFSIDPEDEGAVEWVEDDQGYVRKVHRIYELFDLSPVTYPAYGSDTSVAMRSLDKLRTQKEEVKSKRQGYRPYAPYVEFLNNLKP